MGLLDGMQRPDDTTELGVKRMFPARNKPQMLQMLSETGHKSQMPQTIVGMFQRLYSGKKKSDPADVLGIVLEELRCNSIALDRKGRLELSEIIARPRLREDEEK